MENFMDIFNDDAFNLVSMVKAINEIDNIPGRAGELAFSGVGEGVNTTTVAIERNHESISLIATSARGAPAPQENESKPELFPLKIPQIKMEETIGADRVQGVREFGSTNVLRGVQSTVRNEQAKIVRRMDLTLEHHRLGALKGIIRDSDGSVLLNLFDMFGKEAPADVSFGFEEIASADDFEHSVRVRCQEIARTVRRNAKLTIPASAKIWAFAGDNFMDRLVENKSVKKVWDGWAAAEQRLGASYANGVYYFGGIYFENYAGTDDITGEEASDGAMVGKVGIASNECRLFLTGVPGLYAEYFAPADFADTVNTIGLPRYSRLAVDPEFGRYVKVHVQQNPLPLCLRPQTLIRGTI